MNKIFDWCVDILYHMANIFGISYEEINVIIFVFLYPLFVILLVAYIIHLKRKIKKLQPSSNGS